MRKKLSIITVIIVIMGFQLAGWAKQPKPVGKFYIVGMGTEADLITLRALEVIKKTELILLENEYEREMWKDLIGDRDVWVFRHSARIGLGIDPKTIKDPKMRKLAEKNQKIREDTGVHRKKRCLSSVR